MNNRIIYRPLMATPFKRNSFYTEISAVKELQSVKSKFVCKFIFQLCGFIYATFIFKRFD